MISNKKFEPILIKFFICGRNLLFLSHNHTLQFQKILTWTVLYPEQVAFNHSLHIDFKSFFKIYEKCTSIPLFF